jgi:hypothetical protein
MQFKHTRLTTARTWGKPHLPPYNILCSSPHGPHSNGFLSRDSQMGVLKLPHLVLPRLWGRITSCANLWLQWGLKQSCNPHQELSNGMLHITYKQVNKVNSWLLMVGSQTANLTPGLSFGHNLCYRYSNGRCEPILDIYASIVFQWYKKLFEAMVFDPWNRALKI